MDLSKYNQLEQLSDVQLDYLETSILDVIEDKYTVDSIYIVGSFCFGLDKANDIDIVVCIPLSEYCIVDDDVNNLSIYGVFEELSQLVSRKVKTDIQLIPKNYSEWGNGAINACVNPPRYNLTTRQWIAKQPGDRWNNWIMRQGPKAWAVDRNSNEGRRLAIKHNKIVKYNQLEQLSTQELDKLEYNIADVVTEGYNIKNIFVVGSFCFGLDNVEDIDIVVCIKEPIDVDGLDDYNHNLYKKFEIDYSQQVSKRMGWEISLIPNNLDVFLTNPAKRVKPPMFDLTNRVWINKEPYDKWNYYMVRMDSGVFVIDRDSNEGRRLAEFKRKKH